MVELLISLHAICVFFLAAYVLFISWLFVLWNINNDSNEIIYAQNYNFNYVIILFCL